MNLARKKVAIVGTGIAGLTAAYRLHGHHDLTLFEAGSHVGGHTLTSDVTIDGRSYAVDAGFIVYNEANYPLFSALLAELGVESQPTCMSFGVRCERSGVEYCGTSINTLFAQRRNLLSLSFLRMLADIVRFNRRSLKSLAEGRVSGTLGHLEHAGYSRAFLDRYLLPVAAALWSTEPNELLATPLRFVVDFLSNHGLLTADGHFEWRVIAGGSRQYVRSLSAGFRDRIRLECPVERLERRQETVRLYPVSGEPEDFDEVIVATHSDQALALLAEPTDEEIETLGAIAYQPNVALLHTDATILPRSRRAWASWNYLVPKNPRDQVAVTYNMTTLQSLDIDRPVCVSLNLEDRIDPNEVLGRFQFHHPHFTKSAVEAQGRWAAVSGVNRVHYCGAYWGNGFHEAGVASGTKVAEALSP